MSEKKIEIPFYRKNREQKRVIGWHWRLCCMEFTYGYWKNKSTE